MKSLFTLILVLFLLPQFFFGQADLVVSTAGFQPDIIDKGDIFSVQATVTNLGNITAEANYMFIYYSQDLTVSAEEIISRVSVKELTPNESQTIDFIYPIATPLNSGNYYLAFEVDPFDDVVETDEDNLFCAADATGCVTFNITNTVVTSQKYTYPIIFIHGLAGSDTTWNSFTHQAERYFGWSYGGKLNYCLNPDNDVFSSDNSITDLVNSSTLTVADYYSINFDPSNFGFPSPCYQGNQSAVVKQGWAVQLAIEQVLNITGAEKVILVAHSMGGLAAREYIQNESNWQSDGEHHIAKLFTIATPNGGSAVTGFVLGGLSIGIFEDSEAVRDLRYYIPFLYDAEYLFGGDEDAFSIYVNNDINCDGDIDDYIIGLNYKSISLDINYSCMLDVGDEVVDDDRADLNQYPFTLPPTQALYADKFVVQGSSLLSDHINIHKDPSHFGIIVQGLDEPRFYDLAYKTQLNSLNFGYSTIQSENNPIPPPNNEIDWDDYKIEITENGALEVDIWNIPIHGFALYLLDESYNVLQEVQAIGESNISFDYPINAGIYYIELGSIPTPNSWRFPYAYSVLFTPNAPLVANFASTTQEGCTPFTANFTNQSTGSITSYQWTFQGGTPSFSTLENPNITYSTSGTYPVTLTITDSFGNNTFTQNNYITVKAAPQAEFTFDTQQAEVNLSNQTQFGIDTPTYLWNFGDGETSTASSPTHIYQSNGTYTVVLTATNSCGSSTSTQTVNIMTVATQDLNSKSIISIFPNPSKEKLTLKIEGNFQGKYKINLSNSIGQVVKDLEKTKLGSTLEFQINTFDLPSGTYFIQINSDKESQIRKVIKL